MSEERLLGELSADQAWQTIEAVVEQFPSRLAGTDAAWNAAGDSHSATLTKRKVASGLRLWCSWVDR